MKLGPRFDMGKLVPLDKDGWKFACSGAWMGGQAAEGRVGTRGLGASAAPGM